jgi:redox-sensitive bicupin YhaK (pirin superfamily)
VTHRPGSVSRYSFSFGHHYDATNVSFGPVVAVNDELLEPGAGFEEHRHAGLVIVTYVVAGSLEHQGISSRIVEAGQVAVLRTGAGVVHAERNAGASELRFVQTWLTTGADEVSYDVLDAGDLAGVVRVGEARVLAGTLSAGSAVELTGHLFVARGSLEGLDEGDSLRTTTQVSLPTTAGTQLVAVTWAEEVRSGGPPCGR